jgi:hypothetical protein
MVISLLMESDAKQVQGVGVVGLGAEDVAVAPGGLGQQSALVFLQTEGKLVVHGDALSILKGESVRVSSGLSEPLPPAGQESDACAVGQERFQAAQSGLLERLDPLQDVVQSRPSRAGLDARV